jgi:alpha-galactosidase
MKEDGSRIRPLEAAGGMLAWSIETARTSYVVGVDPQGCFRHHFWGPKLLLDTDYRDPDENELDRISQAEETTHEEYPAWGDTKLNEPCLKATFADRVRSTVLAFVGAEIEESGSRPELVVHLEDEHYALLVELHYRPVQACDLIERKVVLSNQGETPVVLEQVLSALWHLPLRDDYRLTSLAGHWGGEFQPQELLVPVGKHVLESRRGSTGFGANPWFALDADGAANETSGEVWFGALAYSGNWKMVVERTPHNQIWLAGGIHDFDFAWNLAPGERFETPSFVAGYTGEGFGQASRLAHAYQLDHVLPRSFAETLRPVLYNSWYVTGFDVNVDNQRRAADLAARLGVELFVMDDGWFKGRDDSSAGLGDWQVSNEKFPEGLGPLISHVKRLGMEFGIWVEPEMVNPDSDLYRQYPDWVLHFPNRPRTESRQQLVLNAARDDVQDFMFESLHRLLHDHDISFVKWDMNRGFSEPGWPAVEDARQREVWVRYTWGLYSVLERLRREHPQVMFESCASGGGRVDLGIMRYVEQFWMSDNTDAFDDLLIGEGFSLAYAPKTKTTWVTGPSELTNRKVSLQYRFHAAMTGVLGIGADLTGWSEEDMAEAAQLVAQYKQIRETVQHGRLYRLRSPRKGPLTVLQYLARDSREAIVFIFLHSANFGRQRWTVKLRGLEPGVIYEVDGKALLSGAALMNRGLPVTLHGDFVSRLVRIRVQQPTQ